MAKIVTNEELLNDFKRLYLEHGTVTNSIITKYGNHGHVTYKERFGSLENVYAMLNLPACKTAAHRSTIISKELLIEDVMKVFNQFGYLTRDLYIEHGKYSRKPINRIFGSFNEMLKTLELPVNCEMNIPEELLIQELLDLYNEYGYCSSKLIKEQGKFSNEVYQRRFGSINKAYKKAGLPQRTAGNPVTAKIVLNKIDSILAEKHIPEYTFAWLYNDITGRNLYIDGYYPRLGLCVEYNGRQHYEECDTWFGQKDYDTFLKRQYRDERKAQLLREHNLTLLVIRYDEPIDEDSLRSKLLEILPSQVISA